MFKLPRHCFRLILFLKERKVALSAESVSTLYQHSSFIPVQSPGENGQTCPRRRKGLNIGVQSPYRRSPSRHAGCGRARATRPASSSIRVFIYVGRNRRWPREGRATTGLLPASPGPTPQPPHYHAKFTNSSGLWREGVPWCQVPPRRGARAGGRGFGEPGDTGNQMASHGRDNKYRRMSHQISKTKTKIQFRRIPGCDDCYIEMLLIFILNLGRIVGSFSSFPLIHFFRNVDTVMAHIC